MQAVKPLIDAHVNVAALRRIATTLWYLVLLHVLLFAATVGRQTFYGLCLVGLLIMASVGGVARRSSVRLHAPGRPFMLALFVWSMLGALVNASYGIAVSNFGDAKEYFASHDRQLPLELFSIWDVDTSSVNFFVSLSCHAAVLLLAMAHLTLGFSKPTDDRGTSSEAQSGAGDASAGQAPHIPSIVVAAAEGRTREEDSSTPGRAASQPPRGVAFQEDADMDTVQRCLTPWAAARWCFCLALAAVPIPSYLNLPLALLHCVAVFTFCVSASSPWKYHVQVYAARVTTVYGSLLMAAEIVWQNAALDLNLPAVGLQRLFTPRETGAEVVAAAVHFWGLAMAVVCATAIHGNIFVTLTDAECAEWIQMVRTDRKQKRGAKSRRLANAVGSVFPVLSVLLLVALALAIPTLQSWFWMCFALVGFVVPLEVYVAASPVFFVMAAIVFVGSYVAAILRTGWWSETFLMDEQALTVNALHLAFHAAMLSLVILAHVLYRRAPRSRGYLGRAGKRRCIREAIEHMRTVLPQMLEVFRPLADPTSGAVKHENVRYLFEDVSGLIPTEADVEDTWRYFTGGDALCQADLAVDDSIAEIVRAYRVPLLGPMRTLSTHSGVMPLELKRRRSSIMVIGVGSDTDEEEDEEAEETAGGNNDSTAGDVEMRALEAPSTYEPPSLRLPTDALASTQPVPRLGESTTTNDAVALGACRTPRSARRLALLMPKAATLTAPTAVVAPPKPRWRDDNEQRTAGAGQEARVSSKHLDVPAVNGAREDPRVLANGAAQPTRAARESGNGNKPKPSRSLPLTLASSGTAEPGDIHFADFVVMSFLVKKHRMTDAFVLAPIFRLMQQVVLHNAIPFALLAMFVTATYQSSLDALRTVFIVVFIFFLRSSETAAKFWWLLIGYTVLFVASLYAFNLLFNDTTNPPPKNFYGTSVPLSLVGFRLFANNAEAAIYFCLLFFCVAQQRLTAGTKHPSFSAVLDRREWSILATSRYAVGVKQTLATLLTVACFIGVGLLETRSWLVAGFLTIFLAVAYISTYTQRDGVVRVVWLLSTAYSVVALMAVSLYQFESISSELKSWAREWSVVCSSHATVERCLSEMGLRNPPPNRALTGTLFPWFLACAANMIQYTIRATKAGEMNAPQRKSTGPVASQHAPRPTSAEGAVGTIDARNARQQARCEERSVRWRDEDEGFERLRDRLTARHLLLAVTGVHRAVAVLRVCSEEVGKHVHKIVWLSQLFACLYAMRALSAMYAVLFVFDRRGKTVMAYATLCMALIYVYPFQIAPTIPGMTIDWEDYLGIPRKTDVRGSADLNIDIFITHACAFLGGLLYENTKHTNKVHRVPTLEGLAGRIADAVTSAPAVPAVPSATTTTTTTTSQRVGDQQPLLPTNETASAPTTAANDEEELAIPTSIRGHFVHTFRYMQRHLFLDFGFELLVLFLLITVIVTLQRISGACMFVLLTFLVESTSERFTVNDVRIRLATVFVLLAFVVLYALRLGVPEGTVSSGSLCLSAECHQWWTYLGWNVPKADLALLFVASMWLRMLQADVPKTCRRRRAIDGHFTLGSLMAGRHEAVADCRAMRRTDIEAVLPIPAYDVLNKPRTVVERVVQVYTNLFPTAILLFLHGALVSSVISIGEMVSGLVLLAFYRRLCWHFYSYWHIVRRGLLGLVFLQVCAHLPVLKEWSAANSTLATALGVIPWTDDPTTTPFAIALLVATTWSGVLQHRVFNSFAFSLKLATFFRGSLVALERHKLMMSFMANCDQESEKRAVEKQAALLKKLDDVRRARASIGIVVTSTTEVGEKAKTADVSERRFDPKSVPLLSPATPAQPLVLGPSNPLEVMPAVASREVELAFHEPPSPQTNFVGWPVVETASSELRRPPPTIQDILHDLDGIESAARLPPTGAVPPVSSPTATPTEAVAASGNSPVDNSSAAVDTKPGNTGKEEGDKEKAPPKKSKLVARLKKKLDKFAVAAIVWLSLRTYTGELPPDTLTTPLRFLWASYRFAVRHTHHLCFFAMTLNYALSATVVDMVLCMSSVCYALLIRPWPGSHYWVFSLLWVACGIFIKSIVKVLADGTLEQSALRALSIAIVDLGVSRGSLAQSATLSPQEARREAAAFASQDIIMDFVVFGALLLQRQLCIDFGVYSSAKVVAAPPTIEEPVAASSASPLLSCGDAAPTATTSAGEPTIEQPPSTTPAAEEPVRDATPLGFGSRVAQTFVRLRLHVTSVKDNILRRFGSGVDLYTPTLVVEAITLLFFLALYYRLVGLDSGSFLESVQQDLLPGPLVVGFLVLLLVMVADRVIYVLGALRVKFAFHVVLCLAYHIGFAVWHIDIRVHGASVASGLLLFFGKMLYLVMTCSQIRNGFPMHRQHDPFSRSTNFLSALGHKVYRGVPFVFELRALLDWTCTRTTLRYNNWLLVEDLHNELYTRYCDMTDAETKVPTRSSLVRWKVKLTTGALMFFVIMSILFFPLMYYSTFNPSLESNSVSSMTVEVGFGAYTTIFESAALIGPPSRSLATAISRTRMRLADSFGDATKSVQLLNVTSCSASLWSIPPETEAFLLENIDSALRNQTAFDLSVRVDLTRRGSSGKSPLTVTLQSAYTPPRSTLLSLRDAMRNSVLPNASETMSIPLQRFYTPFLFNQPNAVQFMTPRPTRSNNFMDCRLDLRVVLPATATGNRRYWCLECTTLFGGGNTPDDNVTTCLSGGRCDCLGGRCLPLDDIQEPTYAPLYFVTISDQIPQGDGFLPNLGIVALYTTFILTLSSILRGSVTGGSHRLTIQQMADPDPIAEAVTNIDLSRSVGTEEDLDLEQVLFLELLDLLRSSDALLAVTGKRIDDYGADGVFRRKLNGATRLE